MLEDELGDCVVRSRHSLQQLLHLQQTHVAVWHGGDLLQVQHVLGGQQRGQPLEEEILENKEVKIDPDKLFQGVDAQTLSSISC